MLMYINNNKLVICHLECLITQKMEKYSNSEGV